jgi:hypothetical protein
MCMSCGCGEPNEKHGNPDNITLDDLKRAAKAANVETEKAADNIHELASRLKKEGKIDCEEGRQDRLRGAGVTAMGASIAGLPFCTCTRANAALLAGGARPIRVVVNSPVLYPYDAFCVARKHRVMGYEHYRLTLLAQLLE